MRGNCTDEATDTAEATNSKQLIKRDDLIVIKQCDVEQNLSPCQKFFKKKCVYVIWMDVSHHRDEVRGPTLCSTTVCAVDSTTKTANENPSTPRIPFFHHDGEPLTVVAPGNIRLYANIMVSVIFIITDTENHCFFQSAAPVVVVVFLLLN